MLPAPDRVVLKVYDWYCWVRAVPEFTGHVSGESYIIEYYIGFFTSRVRIELTLLGQRIAGGQTVRKVPDWFNGGREGLRAREPSA